MDGREVRFPDESEVILDFDEEITGWVIDFQFSDKDGGGGGALGKEVGILFTE